MRNHDLQALKGPVDDLNRLADFDGAIESYNLFRPHFRLKRGHNVFRQSRQPISKMDDPSNPMRVFNRAMLRCVDKFREKIARKHGFNEPNRAPLRHSSETQSGGETLYAKLTLERRRGQMLALRLRL